MDSIRRDDVVDDVLSSGTLRSAHQLITFAELKTIQRSVDEILIGVGFDANFRPAGSVVTLRGAFRMDAGAISQSDCPEQLAAGDPMHQAATSPLLRLEKNGADMLV